MPGLNLRLCTYPIHWPMNSVNKTFKNIFVYILGFPDFFGNCLVELVSIIIVITSKQLAQCIIQKAGPSSASAAAVVVIMDLCHVILSEIVCSRSKMHALLVCSLLSSFTTLFAHRREWQLGRDKNSLELLLLPALLSLYQLIYDLPTRIFLCFPKRK